MSLPPRSCSLYVSLQPKIIHLHYDRTCLVIHSLASVLKNPRSPKTTVHGIPHIGRHHITVPDTIILDAERGPRGEDLPLNVTFAIAKIMTEETGTPETDEVTAKPSPNLDTRQRRIESASPMKTTAKATGEMLTGKWRTRGTGEVLTRATTTKGPGGSQRGERVIENIGALLSQELLTDSQERLGRRCRTEWMVIPDTARSMTVSKSREEGPHMDRKRSP